jgi:predicted amidohydrolase
MTDTVSITLWATNLAQPLKGPQDWLDALDTVATEAKAAGSDLLVAPEYVSEQWLTYCGPDIDVTKEPAAMAEASFDIIPGIQALTNKHKLDILAGSWPVPNGSGGFNNGAHLFTVGGSHPFVQRKLCLTPAEKAPDSWGIIPATEMQVFEWNGLRCAIIICLDIELPTLSAMLAKSAPDLDLIICPSMTEKMSGYSRVFSCAKARAVELMTTVAVVGCIGATPLEEGRKNVSGAAVFQPCEAELGFTGRFAEIGPFHEAEKGDPLGPRLHAKDIPVGIVRKLRETQPEVWPGAWTGEGVNISISPDGPALKKTA